MQYLQTRSLVLVLIFLLYACSNTAELGKTITIQEAINNITIVTSKPIIETEGIITAKDTSNGNALTPNPLTTKDNRKTWTPLSTAITNTSIKIIDEFASNNGGCELPCWWGITPGETKWQYVNQYYSSISCNIEKGDDQLLFPVITKNIEKEYYNIFGVNCYGNYFSIWEQNSVVEAITVARNNQLEYTKLYRILTDYSYPDKIFLYTYSSVPSDYHPFYLIIFYSKQRILLIYEIQANVEGNVISGCPYSARPSLRTWSNDIYWSDVEIDRIVLGFDSSERYNRIRSLTQATNMTKEEFQKVFSQQQNQECLYTPVVYWK